MRASEWTPLVLLLAVLAITTVVAATFEITANEMAEEAGNTITIGLSIPKLSIRICAWAWFLDKLPSKNSVVRCTILLPAPYDARMVDVPSIRLDRKYPPLSSYVPTYSMPIGGRVSSVTVGFSAKDAWTATRDGRLRSFVVTGRLDSSHDITFFAFGAVAR